MPEFEDDLLTARLDRSAASESGDDAPPAFIAAVRRRRHTRRLQQASLLVLGLLVLSPLIWLVRPHATDSRYVEDDTTDPSPHMLPEQPTAQETRLASTGATLLEVMTANRDLDPGAPILPDVPLGRSSRVLRVADTLNPEAALARL